MTWMRASVLPLAAFIGGTFLVALGHTETASPTIKSVLLMIQGPSALDTFRRPLGFAADSTRNVLVVADTGNHRLVMLDATGRSRGSLSYITDETRGRLCEPRSVALDARGRFFVVDALGSDIEVLTSMGSRLALISPTCRLESRVVRRMWRSAAVAACTSPARGSDLGSRSSPATARS